MEHCDPETLTVSAFGERSLDGRDAEHLLACSECADELARLRATVALARGEYAEAGPAEPADPPARVWDAVADELGLGTTAAPVTARRWQRLPLVAAAALVVLALAGGILVAVRGSDPAPGPSGETVARATLQPLGGESTGGSARWVQTPTGAVLHVEVTDAVSDGYLEVWLLDPDSDRLVSLGALTVHDRAATADLGVPAGIGPGDYPYVDVSDEPLDGDPAHSGVSVARGDLLPPD